MQFTLFSFCSKFLNIFIFLTYDILILVFHEIRIYYIVFNVNFYFMFERLCMDNRGENKLIEKKKVKKEKKIDFIKKKDNTIHSLFEVEHFLCDFKRLINTVKLYKILK